MLPIGFIAAPLLVVIVIATALFGADSPVPSLVFAGIILAIGAGAMRSRAIGRLRTPIWVALWGIGVVAIGQAAGPAPGAAVSDLMVLMAAGAIYLGMASLTSRSSAGEKLCWLINCALLVIGIVAFVDFVTSPDELYGTAKTYHENRLTAAFLSANTAALMFGMASIFSLGQVLRLASAATDTGGLIDRFARGGMVPILVLIFSLTCLCLTASRGGIGLTVLIGSGYGWLISRNAVSDIGWKTMTAGAVAIGLLIVIVSGSALQDRLNELGTDDTGRATMWMTAFRAWQEAPFFGHGFGQFDTAIAPFITKETAPVLSVQGAAHNLILQWLVQTGIVGLLGGTAIVGAALMPIVKGVRKRRRGKRLMTSILAIAALVCLHGMIDYGLEIPAIVWWFAVYLGLGAGTAIADRPRSSKKRRRRKTA